jgi:hypothetical protein
MSHLHQPHLPQNQTLQGSPLRLVKQMPMVCLKFLNSGSALKNCSQESQLVPYIAPKQAEHTDVAPATTQKEDQLKHQLLCLVDELTTERQNIAKSELEVLHRKFEQVTRDQTQDKAWIEQLEQTLKANGIRFPKYPSPTI